MDLTVKNCALGTVRKAVVESQGVAWNVLNLKDITGWTVTPRVLITVLANVIEILVCASMGASLDF